MIMSALRGSPCVLSALFLEQVAARPKEAALQTPREEVTFLQLHTRAAAISDALTTEIATNKGTKERTPIVVIACGSSQVAEICAVLGVILLGGCFVPIDETLPAARLREVMEDAEPSALVLAPGLPLARGAGGGASVTAILEASRSQGCLVLRLDEHGERRETETRESKARGSCVLGNVVHHGPAETPAQPLESAAESARVAGAAAGTDEARLGGVAIGDVVGSGRPRLGDEPGSTSPRKGRGSGEGDVKAGSQVDCESSVRDEEDLLYIMYTSGTTGMPKGVMGTRSGAVNRIRFGWRLCPFRDDGELVARRTPSCFVDFVAEVLSPLLAGIPLFLAPHGAAADPLRLVPYLAHAKATRITVTPSLLASLLRTATPSASPLLPHLHTWQVSGEALHPDLAVLFRELAAPGAQLINLYGSTEVSGDATYCTLDEIIQTARGRNDRNELGVLGFGGVLIGKPLPGVYLSIVGPDLAPVPVGQPGEVLVGGVGVALGYHRRPQETASKFLRSAAIGDGREGEGVVYIPGLEPGRRVVRTGDRVVQRVASGELLWLGRLDGEVKVRGVRVSLEEIETLACRAAGLPAGGFAVAYDAGWATTSDSVGGPPVVDNTITAVATSAPDRGRLVGFFQANDLRKDDRGLALLKRKLALEMTAAQLPALLVPVVGGFPLTTTGKVDKRALLRQHRSPTDSTFKGHLLPETLGGVRPLSLSEGLLRGTSQLNQTLSAARTAVAEGVVAVLPDTHGTIALWLTSHVGYRPESSDVSNTTFIGLGGTSLLAVEAAWLASRCMARTNAVSATVPAPATLLAADDFLCGTLEEAAAALEASSQAHIFAANNLSAREAATAEANTGLSLAGVRSRKSLVPSVSPVLSVHAIPPPAELASAHISPEDRKRGLDFAERAHIGERRTFLAIGRAGAGLRHLPACVGAMANSTRKTRAAAAATVELRVCWSSCLTKCIDATPLVVVPNRDSVLVGLPKRRRFDNGGGGLADEAHVEAAFPECLCQPMPSSSSPSSAHGSGAEETVEERPKPVRVSRESDWHVGEGNVYIGSHSGEFQALNLGTGEREWSFTAGGRIEAGAACSCDGSIVFVGCHDRHLYAFDRSTGSVVWSFKTGDVIKCTPVCVPCVTYPEEGAPGGGRLSANQGAVLVGSHDGILRGLSQANGGLLWSFDCGGALFASPACDADARVVYAATTKGRVVACDCAALASMDTNNPSSRGCVGAEQGVGCTAARQPVVLWEKQLPAPCFSTPAVCRATGNLVLGCVDGGLYCLSSVGEELWVSRQAKGPVFASPCLLPPLGEGTGGDDSKGSGSTIVWGCHDGNVRCRRGLHSAWETGVGRGQPLFSSPCFGAVACDGCALPCPLVFACSVPGLVAALRLSDGVDVGEKQLPGEVFSSAVVAGRTLVVGCRDNRVYALDIIANCARCVETS